MINLIEPQEISDFISIYDFRKLLACQLEKGKEKLSLVNIQNLRAIGKTYSLVEFAKRYDYAVIVYQNAELFRRVDKCNYPKIYNLRDMTVRLGKISNNIVIDECITADNIIYLQSLGYNIITGYCGGNWSNEKNNLVKEQFNTKVVATLTEEANILYEKIKKIREKEDYGTYKNLIIAYRDIVDMINKYSG